LKRGNGKMSMDDGWGDGRIRRAICNVHPQEAESLIDLDLERAEMSQPTPCNAS